MKEVVVDVETGGLNPVSNALCSVTMKYLNEDKILNIFIKPSSLGYNDAAMKINGLTLDFLEEKGVSEVEAVQQIVDFFDSERVEIIGHNVSFDFNFLSELFRRVGENISDYISHHKFDTVSLAMILRKRGIKDFKSLSLGNIYKDLFDEDILNQHSSLADVLATERIFNSMNDLL